MESSLQSYRSHGTIGVNCFSLNELGKICQGGLEPEIAPRERPIRGQNRVNSLNRRTPNRGVGWLANGDGEV